MADPSALPASSPPRGGWRRRGRWVLLALGLTSAAVVVAWKPATKLWQRGEQRYVRWRIERFLNQAGEAVRSERPQVARAALEAAAALSPGDWTIRLARSDQLMNSGEREIAWRYWDEWLAEPLERRPPQLPLLFAGRLIVAGEFGRLAKIAALELNRGSAIPGTWLNLTAESSRLAGEVAGLESIRLVDSPVVAAVISGYQFARQGDRRRATEALSTVRGQAFSRPVAVLCARAWLLLGDFSMARLALARTTDVVTPRESSLQEALFVERGSAQEARLLRQFLKANLDPAERARRAALFMFFTLDGPSLAAAETLSGEFIPAEPSLDTALVSTLWIYCALSGSDRWEREWRARLQVRLISPPPPIGAGTVNVPLLRLTVERVPLPLEIVCALMSRTVMGGG